MTEQEFISLIDCCFPYHDQDEASRLIVLGCSISSNAAYMVVEELARVPVSVKVSSERLLSLLREIDSHFKHPVKKLVTDIATRMIHGDLLTLSETLSAMREVAAFRNQYCALNTIYFSGREPWEDVDILHDEITCRWKSEA